VIDFIYGGDVAEDSMTWELYAAADMYVLPGLKLKCLRSLRKNLSVDNCWQMLNESFKFDLEDTFAFALNFVKRNKSEVAQTDGWKSLTEGKMPPKMLEKILLELM
jgi:hypothetical protein